MTFMGKSIQEKILIVVSYYGQSSTSRSVGGGLTPCSWPRGQARAYTETEALAMHRFHRLGDSSKS